MGEMIELKAADGHTLEAYKATPEGAPKGGLVIIQEIFGLTGQMKRIADRYAKAGYLSILPAMYDRVERGLAIPYTDMARGIEIVQNALKQDDTLADVEAARLAASEAGKTAIMGFCWGGTIVYLASANLDFDCGVSYYGGGVPNLVDQMKPKIPVIYHFGELDQHIPLDAVNKVKQADPDNPLHIYQGADHGFCCDDRDSYNADAAKLSEQRTHAFLAEYL